MHRPQFLKIMKLYSSVGLVLEGGGMRGAYTAGILDVLHDKGLRFGGNVGTSAGATHLCNYISEQKGRNFRIDTVHSKDPRYKSWWNLIRTGNYFDVDFCYGTLPYELDLFDFKKFNEKALEVEIYACVTNVETGTAEYKRLRDIDLDEEIKYVRASASLPLCAKIVEADGKKYLDGGICDSIPFAFLDGKGFKNQVVVLTRPQGYQKEPNPLLPLMKIVYRKYPKFIEAAANRHINYNKSLEQLEAWEQQGKSFVFRPSVDMKIGRLENNTDKLVELYNLGVKDAEANMPALMEFLEK